MRVYCVFDQRVMPIASLFRERFNKGRGKLLTVAVGRKDQTSPWDHYTSDELFNEAFL